MSMKKAMNLQCNCVESSGRDKPPSYFGDTTLARGGPMVPPSALALQKRRTRKYFAR